MSETSNNYITLESHYYGLSGAAIKYQTRNSCAESTGRILERIGHILFPGEEVQVYVLPAEDGCHLDRFWIKAQESPIAATGVLVTFFGTVVILPGQISQIITDTSTRSLNESQIRTNDSQEELNRLQAEALKSDLDERLGNNSVTTEQCLAVVENAEIRRGKNKLFRQLHSDSEINSEKFVAKSGNEVITEIDIHREQFESYIEPIVNEESEVVIEVSAIIEIIGPITRQSQSGHGIKWKGLYHGEDLTYQERVVLSAAEAIEFYISDNLNGGLLDGIE